MGKLLLVSALVLSLLGCESVTEKQAKIEREKGLAAEVKAKADAEQKAKAEQEAKAKADAEKAAKEKKEIIAKLLPKFVKTKDKMDNTITYRHKNYNYYNNRNGTTIYCEVQDGKLYANSVYVNDQWVFHDHFIVKAGDSTQEFSGREQTNVVDNCIEDVYLNSADSEQLVKLITSAPAGIPVMVRLLGKYRHDYNLRAAHRQAINDTWKLYQALFH